MPKTVSCGVLLFNEDAEVFLAHATGTKYWDLLKGDADPGESPLATALREAREEAGLDLCGIHLDDLGILDYRPDKQLHLFAACVEKTSVEPAACKCTSYFVDERTGERKPEMDRFTWAPLTTIAQLCGPSLRRVLGELFAAGLANRLHLQSSRIQFLLRTNGSQGK
jgi:8-oxo-dGTP pyrophosphatase MutT (NUDIX family)